jgi:anti-sigma factor RsiW
MSCRAARPKLSAFLDGDLEAPVSRAVAAHLETCAGCRADLDSLRATLEALVDLPRVACPEPIASRVQEWLELEQRGPGLALLFRPPWAARPLMLPSLLPACLTLLVALAVALLISRDPRATLQAEVRPRAEVPVAREAVQGTEGNPFFPSALVALPRGRAGQGLPVQVLASMDEGSAFFETVVARDGSVSMVTLLEGDSTRTKPLVEALRRARFEPVRVKGRPVAVSVYRLISRQNVFAGTLPSS